MRSSMARQDAWRLEERRKEERYTLILRAGLLEQEGRTAFCIVKNISVRGVQLKVYAQPILHAEASLRVADEHPVTGRIAWTKNDTVGIILHQELDAPTLLRVRQKLRPNRRRAFPRMSVDASALLRTGGQVHRANVRDISSMGARVRADVKLHDGDRIIVELADLPSIKAYVRWADCDEAGLTFETPIPMQIIACWIEGRTAQPTDTNKA